MIIDRLPPLPSAPTTGDELAIERGTGAYKVDFNTFAAAVIAKNSPLPLANGGFGDDMSLSRNAAFHNSIPRGKNLGSAITSEQLVQIAARTYDGMWLGDYWVINGRTHTIASFEPKYNLGDYSLRRGHIGVVSDGGWAHPWNSGSGGTSGGYVSVAEGTVRKYIKDTIQPLIQTDFGSARVLSYRALYPTTYNSSGVATGWAWTDAMTELMDEVEVHGCRVWASSAYEIGYNTRQLDLFRVKPDFKYISVNWWLRSVVSEGYVSYIRNIGNANYAGTSFEFYARTLSLIG